MSIVDMSMERVIYRDAVARGSICEVHCKEGYVNTAFGRKGRSAEQSYQTISHACSRDDGRWQPAVRQEEIVCISAGVLRSSMSASDLLKEQQKAETERLREEMVSLTGDGTVVDASDRDVALLLQNGDDLFSQTSVRN